jgi:hypothetical protein
MDVLSFGGPVALHIGMVIRRGVSKTATTGRAPGQKLPRLWLPGSGKGLDSVRRQGEEEYRDALPRLSVHADASGALGAASGNSSFFFGKNMRVGGRIIGLRNRWGAHFYTDEHGYFFALDRGGHWLHFLRWKPGG